jgi:hypothetical protein
MSHPSFYARKIIHEHKHIQQVDTAIEHYHSPTFYRFVNSQEALILDFMRPGKEYTLTELAHLTKLEKSSVSGRVNHMLYTSMVLVKGQRRKCFFTEIECRTVKLSEVVLPSKNHA